MARVLARTGLLVGIESKSGTYEKPSIPIKLNSNISPKVSFDEIEIPGFSFYGGQKDVITIADWGQMEIEATSCLYDNTDYMNSLLLMCNLECVNVESKANHDEYIFMPRTHSTQTGSIDLILPDRKFKGKGAKANFSLSGKVGDKLEVKFNIKAAYEGEEVAPMEMNNNSNNLVLNPAIISRLNTMMLDGESINLSEFSFEMGNVINYEKFTNIGEFHISDYEPKLKLKMRLEAGKDSGFNAFAKGQVMSFQALFKDCSGKTTWCLEIPKLKISKTPEFEDLDGIYVIEREFIALSDKGDDNFKLIGIMYKDQQ